ncbi:MAG: ABC transporter ATP-binding protein [Planctomycetaceae bacterium]
MERQNSELRYSTGQLLARLLRLAFGYRRACVLVVGMHGMLVLLNLATLGLTGLGIDFLQSQATGGALPRWPLGLTPGADWSAFTVIVLLSSAVLAGAVLSAVLKSAAAVASAALSQRVLLQLRTEIYARLQRLSFRFYDSGQSSSIINRAAGDANNVRAFLDSVLIRVLTVLLTLFTYFVYMLQVHAGLTLACLASTPLLWAGSMLFSRSVQPAYLRASELGDGMIRTLVENLQGMQVVKAFARTAEQAGKFEAANESIRSVKFSIFQRMSTFQPLMGLLTQLNMLVLIGYGGRLVIQGQLSLGSGLFVFAGLLQEFAAQVAHITGIVNSVQSSLASAGRVFEVLDEPEEIRDAESAGHLPGVRESLEFRSVSFGYVPDQPVLEDISLKLRVGECVAITGPTGAGKTTLLMLLKRFYDPTSGEILIDGRPLRDLRLADVRAASGLVFQDSFLFGSSIAENIAFGAPEAAREDIESAARSASAHEFICGLPDGYDSVVGEHGANLSGGQRQRLALARALLLQPAVLLLDDATSAVDPETEREIRLAIERVMRGRTTILVSTRFSTLCQADRVIVLQSGRITAEGTAEQLLERSTWFRRLAELQSGGHEAVSESAEESLERVTLSLAELRGTVTRAGRRRAA